MRQVPGTDAADDAKRQAQRVIDGASFHGVGLAVPGDDRGREVAQIGNRARNVDLPCQSQRLAGVARFGGDKGIKARLKQIGQALDPPRPLDRRRARPARRRCLRRPCCGIDITGIRIRAARKHLAGRRLRNIDIATPRRRHEPAIDEVGKSQGEHGVSVPVSPAGCLWRRAGEV
jgi:hypothetical protein